MKLGRIGRINQEAAKINKQIFDEQENKICGVSGCTNLATQPHHRHNRDYYKCKDKKKIILKLTDQSQIVWVCSFCHLKLPPGSEESERLFDAKNA